MQYCDSIWRTKRRMTREVKVGDIGVGGNNPIRTQSMTTSNTRDVPATIEQVMQLADRGCEIVRMTVQGMKEAEACEAIKNGLLQKGYTVPLVADIHFYPPAAMRVIDSVDKVRINPGNFADRRASFKVIEYSDDSYSAELARIEELFTPLVEKCKKLKKALRIGTNHGSLSDRIMNRYGDTPMGMVESAFEYARICRKLDFHDMIFSMKASNPLVMVQAYRLLVAEMMKVGWDYPLHLGVTESGEGEDGRVKSSIGIGGLLLDGLGDTIRVSLTEDPWAEIDPCKRLVQFAQEYQEKQGREFSEHSRDFNALKKRPIPLTSSVLHRDGTVVLPVHNAAILSDTFFVEIGLTIQLGRFVRDKTTVDALLVEEEPTQEAFERLQQVEKAGVSLIKRAEESEFSFIRGSDPEERWEVQLASSPSFILFSPTHSALHETRHFIEWLRQKNLDIPVLLYLSYACSEEDFIIRASAEAGALLGDGLGDGLALNAKNIPLDTVRRLSFSILQGVRMRTSKTEFISCPGCGRTLFELQQVSKNIRARTGHLPGVKIAIMGCIVNGPGEMADADFGYVGSKPGKIDLYVGKECVERDIAFADAENKLVDLIKRHGRWEEPVEPAVAELSTSL